MQASASFSLPGKSITFSERVTDRLTRSLYNFAHFLVAIVKSLTAIALVWYRAARAKLLIPVLNVPEGVHECEQTLQLARIC